MSLQIWWMRRNEYYFEAWFRCNLNRTSTTWIKQISTTFERAYLEVITSMIMTIMVIVRKVSELEVYATKYTYKNTRFSHIQHFIHSLKHLKQQKLLGQVFPFEFNPIRSLFVLHFALHYAISTRVCWKFDDFALKNKINPPK